MEQYTLTIPEDILFSDSLTPTDKLVYGLLHSQDKPSVKQISKIVNRSERTIWRAKKKYTNTDIHVTKETLTTDTYVSDTNVSTDTDVTPPTDTDVSDTYVSVKDTIEHRNNVNKVLKFIKTLTSQETYNEKRKRILEIYTHKELFTDEDFALFDEKIDEMRSKFEEI